MGKDVYEEFEAAKAVYNKANEVLGIDVARLCFESSEEELGRTDSTQIAILVTSLAMLEVLKEMNVKADITAGLSLGEYTALIYSGKISFEDGLKLVKKRGEYMQNLIPEGNWKMAAILGLENIQIEEICNYTNKNVGFISPANYNYPGQVVVSGEEKAVEEAIEIASEEGAKKTILLNTNGPFHTKKLENASMEFAKELEKVQFKNGEMPVIKNIDGTPYTEKDDVKEILAGHMISPVRFDKTIEYMLKNGVDRFMEIGPGRTLTGFIRKVNKEVETISVSDSESLNNVIMYECTNV